MKVLVTGSAGHLGEGLMRTLPAHGHEPLGLDLLSSPYTQLVGSITDRALVRRAMEGVEAVLHTATLHKPHVATHSRQAFVDTNITGTLNLLEEARGLRAFIFTSTTSAFGMALHPKEDEPAAWITEQTQDLPKNIYGVTKVAAESLCALFHQKFGLPCLVLRTSRFFPEEDDSAEARAAFEGDNAKVNELLYRRADLEDVVSAHVCALAQAERIGFGRYIISATAPFVQAECLALHRDAPAVVARRFPGYEALYAQRGWRMFPRLDRIYVNALARAELGWRPRFDFGRALALLEAGEDYRSELARAVGKKRYHAERFQEGPYPVEGVD